VGVSGFLQVSELTIDSFETEDNVIVTALKDDGEEIAEDVAKKLFALNAEINQNSAEIINDDIKQKEQESVNILTMSIAERNSEFFDDEVDKLDKWAEDRRTSLKASLKARRGRASGRGTPAAASRACGGGRRRAAPRPTTQARRERSMRRGMRCGRAAGAAASMANYMLIGGAGGGGGAAANGAGVAGGAGGSGGFPGGAGGGGGSSATGTSGAGGNGAGGCVVVIVMSSLP
jgi:hypothetical protein